MSDQNHNGESASDTFVCTQCTRCCELLVPITLVDLDNVARRQGVDPSEALERYAVPYPNGSCLALGKNEIGKCHFLENKLCGLHDVPGAKPWICRMYECGLPPSATASPDKDTPIPSPDEALARVANSNDEAIRGQLWEVEAAKRETRDYVRRHGAHWHERDYHAALAAVSRRIETRRTVITEATRLAMAYLEGCVADGRDADYSEAVVSIRTQLGLDPDVRVTLARADDGGVRAVAFDCLDCTERQGCCREAPVTFDDIVRISAEAGTDLGAFFERHVAPRRSSIEPRLLALRNADTRRCPFLGVKTGQCGLETPPMHCRFLPCPMFAGAGLGAERFYLGSGTLEEHFRHQMALAVTAKYTGEFGVGYDPEAFERMSRLLDRLVSDQQEWRLFLETMAQHRHIGKRSG